MTNHVDRDVGILGLVGADAASTAVIAIGSAQSWVRLRSQDVGRLGISLAGQPLVFPVNYAVNEESIVFRTAPGTMLDRAAGSPACFEIDYYDAHSREGWSVMVIGTLEDITDLQDSRSLALRGLALQTLAPGPRARWVALRVRQLSGREFTAGWFAPGNWLG
jgi:nitroimidazol reductase NimA-like FMN-containing flavoprotein (pyridoxamine 5'-phosphate oxidase superfamily)